MPPYTLSQGKANGPMSKIPTAFSDDPALRARMADLAWQTRPDVSRGEHVLPRDVELDAEFMADLLEEYRDAMDQLCEIAGRYHADMSIWATVLRAMVARGDCDYVVTGGSETPGTTFLADPGGTLPEPCSPASAQVSR